jgi:hypothetical protein
MSCCAIGLRVVEATKAWRILRTRGETGLFFRFAVLRGVVGFFLAAVDLCGGFFAPD